MRVQRRPVSRRPAGGTTARPSPSGESVVGTIDAPIDDGQPELTDAEIRAARAEERRYRPEETAPPSVLGERLGGVRRIFDDTRAEVKKITWPDRETTRNLTLVVIAVSVALGIVLGGIDFVLFQIFEATT